MIVGSFSHPSNYVKIYIYILYMGNVNPVWRSTLKFYSFGETFSATERLCYKPAGHLQLRCGSTFFSSSSPPSSIHQTNCHNRWHHSQPQAWRSGMTQSPMSLLANVDWSFSLSAFSLIRPLCFWFSHFLHHFSITINSECCPWQSRKLSYILNLYSQCE